MSATGTAVAAAQSPATPSATQMNDMLFVQLAREIAMDIHPLDKILKFHGLDTEQWNEIRDSAKFNDYLRIYVQEWNSATSTEKRVKLKAMSLVEEAMPEMFAQIHKANEALPGKVKAFEVVSKIAGLGAAQAQASAAGEKFSITINMGADEKLVINGNPPPKPLIAEDQ